MSGFVFRYEQVLKLRTDQETSIKNELAKALKQLFDLEEALRLAIEEKKAFYRHVDTRMHEGVEASELQNLEQSKIYLKNAIQKKQYAINRKNKEILEIRAKLLEATKEKKKLEKLKEKELEAFKKEEQIADDKLNDQIVTFNSSLRRR